MMRARSGTVLLLTVLGGAPALAQDLPAGPSPISGRSISGVVLDRTAAVVSGARVAVRCGGNARAAISDGRGNFNVHGLPAARCSVDVRHDGFERRSLLVDLGAPSPVDVRIVLDIEGIRTDVMVTPARGASEKAYDVPRGTSTVTAEDLEARPHTLLTQTLREQTGVLAQSTTAAQGSPIIRGMTGQRNVYLIDGVRLNTSAWRDGPSQYLAWIPASVVSRLEIVRGPGSVPYGSDALGGTFHVLSQRPELSPDGLRVSGSGSVMLASANGAGGANASIALGHRRFAFRFGGSHTRVDDVRTGEAMDSRAAVTRFLGLPSRVLSTRLRLTGYDQSSAQLGATLRPDERNEITLLALHSDQDGASRYDRMDGGAGLYRSEFRPQRLFFSALRYTRTRVAFADEFTATFSINRQDDGRLEQARPSATIDEQVTQTTAVGYQLQGTRRLGTRGMVIAGGEAYDEDIGGSRTVSNPATGLATAARPDIPNQTRYLSAAAFGQTILTLIPDRLTVRGGLRYAGSTFSTQADPSLNVGHERVDTGAATYDAGASVAVQPWLHITASVSRGFRAANAFDLGGIGITGGPGLEVAPSRVAELGALRGSTDGATAVSTGQRVAALGAEVLVAYETGAKVRTRRLSASANVFDLELYDSIERRTLIFDRDVVGTSIAGYEIVRQDAEGRAYVAQDPRPIVTRVNVSRGRIRGFEADGSLQLTGAWRAGGWASMANGSDRQSGAYLRRMPPAMGGTALRYTAQGGTWWVEGFGLFASRQDRLSDGDFGDARIGASRTRANIASYFNGTAMDLGLVQNGRLLATGETLGQVQERVLGSAAAAPMFTSTAGFTVFGARAIVNMSRRFRLVVIGDNLTDRNYRLHGSGLDEAGIGVQARLHVQF
jgi:hemoglobin/transferrin/lactoferrin receptor protein